MKKRERNRERETFFSLVRTWNDCSNFCLLLACASDHHALESARVGVSGFAEGEKGKGRERENKQDRV
jgi:hypothetical protein